jgi:hypothetical protein
MDYVNLKNFNKAMLLNLPVFMQNMKYRIYMYYSLSYPLHSQRRLGTISLHLFILWFQILNMIGFRVKVHWLWSCTMWYRLVYNGGMLTRHLLQCLCHCFLSMLLGISLLLILLGQNIVEFIFDFRNLLRIQVTF